jgi:hypothetical protein
MIRFAIVSACTVVERDDRDVFIEQVKTALFLSFPYVRPEPVLVK